jgi:DNA-binding transcriptional LysR family regulator
MTLRQLEVFLAVAREKSFSLAAKKIHSSQPTLSEHVSELETELGKPLFFRRGRRRIVAVTEAGRVFAEFAERAISAIEDGRQALADLDGLTHGSLLIGASTTPGLYVLPRIIAAFRTKYPGVDVKLQIANSQAIEGRVRERELDLGIVGGHALRPGEECLTSGMRESWFSLSRPSTHGLDVGTSPLTHLPITRCLCGRKDLRPAASRNARCSGRGSSSAWRWSWTIPRRSSKA